MAKRARFTYGVTSMLVVVGYDPEMADMDNPRGAIIRERFFACAEDAEGYRFTDSLPFKTADEAGRYAWTFGGTDAALDFADVGYAYGSVAYQRNEHEVVEAERAHDREWHNLGCPVEGIGRP